MGTTRLIDKPAFVRPASCPDAEVAGLTLLHLDKDFELITEITGQPVERPRFS